MARPITWLPRLHEIRRSVRNSVRSHYGRRDLETLFLLQPRAAQYLLDLFPLVRVGTSQLVESDTLSAFLERVHTSDDVSALLSELRRKNSETSRRKIREFVQTESALVSLSSLPSSVILEPGRLEIRFETLEQLAQSLFSLAQVMTAEPDALGDMVEIREPAPPLGKEDEISCMFRELELMEAAHLKTIS